MNNIPLEVAQLITEDPDIFNEGRPANYKASPQMHNDPLMSAVIKISKRMASDEPFSATFMGSDAIQTRFEMNEQEIQALRDNGLIQKYHEGYRIHPLAFKKAWDAMHSAIKGVGGSPTKPEKPSRSLKSPPSPKRRPGTFRRNARELKAPLYKAVEIPPED